MQFFQQLLPGSSLYMVEEYPLHKIDALHWDRLRRLKPEDVVVRSKCSLHDTYAYYEIECLGDTVWVDPQGERFVSPPGEVFEPRIECALAILVYLIEVKNIPLSGRLVSAKDLKGGEMFFRGPHCFPVAPLEEKFGNDNEGFLAAGEKYGGSKGTYGDASFRLMAFPRVPIQTVLWRADEDFHARINFLFDSTIEQHIPFDIIYGLVSELCFRLGED
jgi:hypothetical protein